MIVIKRKKQKEQKSNLFLSGSGYYFKVLELDPDDDFAYREYINLVLTEKTNEEAIKEIESLLKVSRSRRNAHLYGLKGDKLKKLNHHLEAIEVYKKALEIKPENLYLLRQMGFCHSKLGNFREVISNLKAPFLKDPGDHYTQKSIVSAYYKINDTEELLDLLKRAYKEHPDVKALLGLMTKAEKEIQKSKNSPRKDTE